MSDWNQEEIDALPQSAVEACLSDEALLNTTYIIEGDICRIMWNNGVRFRLTGALAAAIISAAQDGATQALESWTPPAP